MNENKGIGLPYWLLKLLPMWDHICPKCRKEVKQKSHTCIHCGENYGVPLRVPPKVLSDAKALEQYVHQYIFPKISSVQREYLTQFFTVLFSDGFECPPNTAPNTFTAWSGINGAPTIVVTAPHHGAYCMKSPTSSAYAYYTFGSAYSELYLRAYCKRTTVPTSNTTQSIVLQIFSDNTGVAYASAVFGWDGLLPYFKLHSYTDGGVLDQVFSAIPAVSGQWHCVELWWKQNTLNGAKMWIDGVLGATSTITTRNSQVNQIRVGNMYSDDPVETFIDCVVAADTRIYCEVSAAPKGTIAIHCKIAEII